MTWRDGAPQFNGKRRLAETIRSSRRLGAEWAGARFDQVLAELFPDHSRSRLQQWTREGGILVDGGVVKPNYRVRGGETVAVDVTLETVGDVRPQAIGFPILHEDEQIIVIDKPAGMVVHPAAGNRDSTLQNALLHHDPELARLPRAGIVHRLDKLTSGVMVVARTPTAHTHLVRELQARRVSREYRCIAHGPILAGATIDAPLGRHPRDRVRMAVRADGKPAVTHYRVAHRYRDFTVLAVRLETGRTHQIRVHLAHVGHPLVGDPVYGGRPRQPAGASEGLKAALAAFGRQALHARHLGFIRPASGEPVRFSAPWPADLEALRQAIDDDEEQRRLT